MEALLILYRTDVAKDSDASLGTRMEAGKDAASDKLDETKHSAAEEKNKH